MIINNISFHKDVRSHRLEYSDSIYYISIYGKFDERIHISPLVEMNENGKCFSLWVYYNDTRKHCYEEHKIPKKYKAAFDESKKILLKLIENSNELSKMFGGDSIFSISGFELDVFLATLQEEITF